MWGATGKHYGLEFNGEMWLEASLRFKVWGQGEAHHEVGDLEVVLQCWTCLFTYSFTEFYIFHESIVHEILFLMFR